MLQGVQDTVSYTMAHYGVSYRVCSIYSKIVILWNEELLGLIPDPTTACMLEENSDSGETQIFSLARGLCYALHVQRNILLASV